MLRWVLTQLSGSINAWIVCLKSAIISKMNKFLVGIAYFVRHQHRRPYSVSGRNMCAAKAKTKHFSLNGLFQNFGDKNIHLFRLIFFFVRFSWQRLNSYSIVHNNMACYNWVSSIRVNPARSPHRFPLYHRL